MYVMRDLLNNIYHLLPKCESESDQESISNNHPLGIIGGINILKIQEESIASIKRNGERWEDFSLRSEMRQGFRFY